VLTRLAISAWALIIADAARDTQHVFDLIVEENGRR
jgi:hypothetical protein